MKPSQIYSSSTSRSTVPFDTSAFCHPEMPNDSHPPANSFPGQHTTYAQGDAVPSPNTSHRFQISSPDLKDKELQCGVGPAGISPQGSTQNHSHYPRTLKRVATDGYAHGRRTLARSLHSFDTQPVAYRDRLDHQTHHQRAHNNPSEETDHPQLGTFGGSSQDMRAHHYGNMPRSTDAMNASVGVPYFIRPSIADSRSSSAPSLSSTYQHQLHSRAYALSPNPISLHLHDRTQGSFASSPESDKNFDSDHSPNMTKEPSPMHSHRLLPQSPGSSVGSDLDGQCCHIADDELSSHRSVSVATEQDTPKPKKVKMHQCDECQKRFPRPSGLSTHKNSHSGAKPFKCPFPECDKSFTVQSNAKRHFRTHRTTSEPEVLATPPIFNIGFHAPQVSNAQELTNTPKEFRWVPPSLGPPTNLERPQSTPASESDADDDVVRDFPATRRGAR